MIIPDNSPNILVYHCITAPIPSTDEVAKQADEWTRDYVNRGRYYFADNGVALRCAHPLFAQVVGFACAELILEGVEFKLQDLRVSVGNERRCLTLAREAHERRSRFLMNYAAWGWMPKFIYARSLAIHTLDGTSPAPLMGRVIDLADIVSLGGLVGAPPLHLALAAQGIARIPRPLATDAIAQLLAAGDHAPICRELATHLWAASSLYARMHLGPGYSVAKLSLPPEHSDHSPTNS